MTTPNKINFPPPKLQIDFAFALKRFRAVYLQSALLETVRDMDIAELDKQLAEYVPPADLATLAQYGLRAELLFAVPAVLEANPYLLGYYRLLMGYSQKEFYGRDKGFGVGYFKSMEEKGKTSKAAAADLPDLCVAFCATASALLAGDDARHDFLGQHRALSRARASKCGSARTPVVSQVRHRAVRDGNKSKGALHGCGLHHYTATSKHAFDAARSPRPRRSYPRPA